MCLPKTRMLCIPFSPPVLFSLTDILDRELEAEVVPKVVKHDRLWFADGNIVLQTTSPSEHEIHLLRCHKSVLSGDAGAGSGFPRSLSVTLEP